MTKVRRDLIGNGHISHTSLYGVGVVFVPGYQRQIRCAPSFVAIRRATLHGTTSAAKMRHIHNDVEYDRAIDYGHADRIRCRFVRHSVAGSVR